MGTRDELEKKAVGLRGAVARARQRGLSAPAVQLCMEVGIHTLLGAVLAGGVVLEGCAPFGISLVAASGTGLCGAGALLGVGFGYLTLLPFSDALRCFSAAILTFSVAFAFYDWKVLRRPWAMAILAGFMNGCTGFIYLSQGGWTEQEGIHFLLELALTVGSTYCFRAFLLSLRQNREETPFTDRERGAALVMVCCVLTSLSGLYLYRDLSLGRALGGAVILAGAWKGGQAVGAVLGVSIGLALDLSSGRPPLYAAAWGLAALGAGSCQKRTRPWAAAVFCALNTAVALWTWENSHSAPLLLEGFLGGGVFLALPKALFKMLAPLVSPPTAGGGDLWGQEQVRRRLEDTAAAFRSLYHSMRGAFRAPQNDNDVAAVFDRAACQVCRKCSLRSNCWEREYNTTFNALNDATPAMLSRGRGLAGDFPTHFTSRCLHFPALLDTINQELTALLYRRQYNARLVESRAAVCRQYGELSALLDRAAAELSRELVPDLPGERRLRQHLAVQGLEPECSVYRDEFGRLHAHLRGEGWREAAQNLPELEKALGLPMRLREEENGAELIQLEPLMAVAGIAARKKDGETVCGDAGTYFKGEDGVLYLLLCDGMGSGQLAHRESTLAVRLLEQFLQAGVDTEHALITLSSALALRNEAEGGFTTVDLLQVDLFTGAGSIYKLGAAPTYLRRGDSVRKISGTSLPAGLAGSGRPDCTRIHLEPGDYVLMVSDGVAGTGDDSWVAQRLRQFQGDSPKELARSLITDSPEGATDDRTALVVKIAKRG